MVIGKIALMITTIADPSVNRDPRNYVEMTSFKPSEYISETDESGLHPQPTPSAINYNQSQAQALAFPMLPAVPPECYNARTIEEFQLCAFGATWGSPGKTGTPFRMQQVEPVWSYTPTGAPGTDIGFGGGPGEGGGRGRGQGFGDAMTGFVGPMAGELTDVGRQNILTGFGQTVTGMGGAGTLPITDYSGGMIPQINVGGVHVLDLGSLVTQANVPTVPRRLHYSFDGFADSAGNPVHFPGGASHMRWNNALALEGEPFISYHPDMGLGMIGPEGDSLVRNYGFVQSTPDRNIWWGGNQYRAPNVRAGVQPDAFGGFPQTDTRFGKVTFGVTKVDDPSMREQALDWTGLKKYNKWDDAELLMGSDQLQQGWENTAMGPGTPFVEQYWDENANVVEWANSVNENGLAFAPTEEAMLELQKKLAHIELPEEWANQILPIAKKLDIAEDAAELIVKQNYASEMLGEKTGQAYHNAWTMAPGPAGLTGSLAQAGIGGVLGMGSDILMSQLLGGEMNLGKSFFTGAASAGATAALGLTGLAAGGVGSLVGMFAGGIYDAITNMTGHKPNFYDRAAIGGRDVIENPEYTAWEAQYGDAWREQQQGISEGGSRLGYLIDGNLVPEPPTRFMPGSSMAYDRFYEPQEGYYHNRSYLETFGQENVRETEDTSGESMKIGDESLNYGDIVGDQIYRGRTKNIQVLDWNMGAELQEHLDQVYGGDTHPFVVTGPDTDSLNELGRRTNLDNAGLYQLDDPINYMMQSNDATAIDVVSPIFNQRYWSVGEEDEAYFDFVGFMQELPQWDSLFAEGGADASLFRTVQGDLQNLTHQWGWDQMFADYLGEAYEKEKSEWENSRWKDIRNWNAAQWWMEHDPTGIYRDMVTSVAVAEEIAADEPEPEWTWPENLGV